MNKNSILASGIRVLNASMSGIGYNDLMLARGVFAEELGATIDASMEWSSFHNTLIWRDRPTDHPAFIHPIGRAVDALRRARNRARLPWPEEKKLIREYFTEYTNREWPWVSAMLWGHKIDANTFISLLGDDPAATIPYERIYFPTKKAAIPALFGTDRPAEIQADIEYLSQVLAGKVQMHKLPAEKIRKSHGLKIPAPYLLREWLEAAANQEVADWDKDAKTLKRQAWNALFRMGDRYSNGEGGVY